MEYTLKDDRHPPHLTEKDRDRIRYFLERSKPLLDTDSEETRKKHTRKIAGHLTHFLSQTGITSFFNGKYVMEERSPVFNGPQLFMKTPDHRTVLLCAKGTQENSNGIYTGVGSKVWADMLPAESDLQEFWQERVEVLNELESLLNTLTHTGV